MGDVVGGYRGCRGVWGINRLLPAPAESVYCPLKGVLVESVRFRHKGLGIYSLQGRIRWKRQWNAKWKLGFFGVL